MGLKGKRTYIIAIILALMSIYIWYRLRDDAALTGLFTSISMIGMRRITGKTLIAECEQIFGGINKMVDYTKLMADAAKLFADGMAMEAYFQAHPEIMTMLQDMMQDMNNIIADIEATSAAKSK